LRPFQSIQVDYTEIPKIGHLKYLLVIVDHLTHWIKDNPFPGVTATNVIRVLLENILPRFRVMENTDSDNGSHFTTTYGGSRDQMGISYSLASTFLRES
jgi:hypothetical protein